MLTGFTGVTTMIRKLLLPAIAIALLGGCVTAGYGYRHDRGDYYYGQPSVDYRYYGSPYGSPYYRYGYPGYRGYPGYPYGYGGYYGYPYQLSPGYPYYPYPYRPRPPVVVVPRPDDDPPPPRIDDRDGRRPPWRDLDNLRRRGDADPPRNQPLPLTQSPVPMRPAVRRDEGGSRSEQIMRRAREEGREREIE